jgi:hypothetical protein
VIDHKVFLQHLPGFFGNIGHGIKGVGRFLPEPLIHLIAPESFITALHEKIPQLFLGQGPYVFLLCFHSLKIIKKKIPLVGEPNGILIYLKFYPKE